MPQLPSGTVTFLYTDIEGSTPMWDRNPQAMQASVERHNAILREAIESRGGKVYKVIGDAFQVAFSMPSRAVEAAIAAQLALAAEDWGKSGPIRVRMGIHTGPAEARAGDYVSSSSHQTLNRVARIMSAGHGGQILVSLAVEELTRGQLTADISLKAQGEHHLRGLNQPERIFQVVAPGLKEHFPPLATMNTQQHNLPAETTPFVGREAEIKKVTSLLHDPACRLLTVLAPGGMGKSRLATRASQKLLGDFRDGVWFVALAPLRAAEHIANTVATALNVPTTGQLNPEERVVNYLREKETLIVLDNYEHLLPEGVSLVIDLLQHAPGVKLLVTSRERLGLQGEWIFELHGLTYPKNGQTENLDIYDAVNLFLQHARRVSGFPLSEQEKACVARLSQIVEGMPLALVLAASWTNTLNCSSILREIQRNLDFLGSGLRDVPDRHRSVQAVFEQSWKLLTREEQSIFKRLSVFRGGFDREAAELIAVASLRVLATLVDKSLLHRDANGRYQVHELLRQFLSEKLGDAPEDANYIRQLHCSYYANYLHARFHDMTAARQKEAVEEIFTELQNIRAAWEWAIDHAMVEEIQKSAGSLHWFCQIKCFYREGVEGGEQAAHSLETVAQSELRDITLAEVLEYLGWLNIRLGKFGQAREALEKSLTIYQGTAAFDAPGEGIDPLSALGILAVTTGNYQRAAELGEASLQMNTSRGDQWHLAFSHYVLANAYLAQGAYEKARTASQRAYAITESRGERLLRAYNLIDLGNVARAQGDYKQARQHYQACYALREEFDDSEGMAVALNHLGEVALLQQDYSLAEEHYQRSLAAYQGLGDRGGLATALNGLGQAKRCQGNLAAARESHAEALQIAAEIQYMPLMISALTNVSELFLQTGQYRRGAEVLGLVLNHPATDQPAKERVWRILAEYEEQIPLEALKEARERKPGEDLENMIAMLQAELLTM
jgi:predicted ATPase/class 3 adenylate cyclase/uncharacterized protein HemY